MAAPEKSDANWVKALDELRALDCDPSRQPPSGWHTNLFLSQQWCVSRYTTARLLTAGIIAGLWEMKKFHVKTPSGIKNYLTPHYKKK